ncbi:MAG: DUF6263 family protein [Chitinophagaceae bacterium]
MYKKLSLLSLLFLATYAAAQTPVQQIKVSAGQKIKIVDSLTFNIVQEAMGQTMEMPGATSSSTLLEIKSSDADKSILTSTLLHISFNSSVMGQDMDYDSDKPADKGSEVGKAFEEKLNKAENITLDNSGKTVPSPEKIAIKEEEPNGGAADMIKNLTGGVGGNSTENAFMLLPTNSTTGSAWSDSTVFEGIKTTRTYIIKSIDNNLATITVMGVMSGSRKMEMQGMEMNMTAGGKLDGEIIVDISNGLVKKRTSVVEPSNSIDVMGMSVPVTGKLTTVTYYQLQ